MRKCLILSLFSFLFLSTYAQQTLTFKDGSTVKVNSADFSYAPIRKASLGLCIGVDGNAGTKLFTGSYLSPEVFDITANVGYSSASAEGIFFFSGKTKMKNKSFGVRYGAAGYHAVNVYAWKTQVEKRKEWGVYLAANDYGHMLKADASNPDAFSFSAQTTVYAGIAAVNYWHADMDVDNNFIQRGQYIGRTVLAPFIQFGTRPLENIDGKENMPKYGARLFYELSNTVGLFGGKKRGRTNFVMRMGADFLSAPKKIHIDDIEPIFGIGIVYNFL